MKATKNKGLTSMSNSSSLKKGAPGGKNQVQLDTPTTVMRLMQQHRENERHRHRGLNASINAMVQRIPGYCSFTRGSKVNKIDKLHRIVAYITYLEEHLKSICEDLGIAYSHVQNIMSSNNLRAPYHVVRGVTRRSRRCKTTKILIDKSASFKKKPKAARKEKKRLDTQSSQQSESVWGRKNDDVRDGQHISVSYENSWSNSEHVSIFENSDQDGQMTPDREQVFTEQCRQMTIKYDQDFEDHQLVSDHRKLFTDYSNCQTFTDRSSRQVVDVSIITDNGHAFTDHEEQIVADHTNVSTDESDYERLEVQKEPRSTRMKTAAVVSKGKSRQRTGKVVLPKSLPIVKTKQELDGNVDCKSSLPRAYIVVLPRLTRADRLMGLMASEWTTSRPKEEIETVTRNQNISLNADKTEEMRKKFLLLKEDGLHFSSLNGDGNTAVNHSGTSHLSFRSNYPDVIVN